jgi:hypothetical protein
MMNKLELWFACGAIGAVTAACGADEGDGAGPSAGGQAGATATGGTATGGQAGATATGGTATGGQAGATATGGTSTGGAAGEAATTGGAAGTGGSAAPVFSTDFLNLDGWGQRTSNPGGGSITVVPSAASDDNSALELMFPGDPALGSADRASPSNATEVDSNQSFLYGRFEISVRFASCASGEEVVNGIFTYFNDGSDLNTNGMADNSEIDIELLCGEPQYLSLTVWRDYTDDANFYKNSRVIDMRDGSYDQTADGEEGVYGLGVSGAVPGVALADFPNPNVFYHLGFEWRSTYVRYFIVIGGTEVELWRLEKAGSIPQRQAQFLLNVWHTTSHWMTGGAADYPAADATMLVDWVRIWE